MQTTEFSDANQTILTAVMTSDFVATPPALGSRPEEIGRT